MGSDRPYLQSYRPAPRHALPIPIIVRVRTILCHQFSMKPFAWSQQNKGAQGTEDAESLYIHKSDKESKDERNGRKWTGGLCSP